MKPYTTLGRVVIPCYCWVKKPGTETRCTLSPHAKGNHFNMFSRTEWPNGGPEPQ